VRAIVDEVKRLESAGFQYEGADASFELLMQKALHGKVSHFKLLSFRVTNFKPDDEEHALSEATVRIEAPDGTIEHTAAQGNGPLNALDRALRKALNPYYPALDRMHLLDYKVRVLGGGADTDATVRVLIESGDDETKWGTVGVSQNVIEASWQALVDSVEYKLYKDDKAGAPVRDAKTPDAAATAQQQSSQKSS
jgi:2-isopropylmalate synthase